MGKFPGKPSKIINRKRIKVSKCSSSRENESLKAAESIYYGLAVFNETFGNEEQVTSDLEGFTLQETKQAVTEARRHLAEVDSIFKSQGLNVSRLESFNREVAELDLDSLEEKSSPPNKVKKRIRKQQCFDGGGESENFQRLRRNIVTSKRTVCSNNTSLKNSAAKKLLQKAKKSSSYPVISNDSSQCDKGGAIRKFVLPSRSAHSSRVIKPNKRFIEGDEVSSEVRVVRSTSAIQLKKPKLILNPLRNAKHIVSNNESCGFDEALCESEKSDSLVDNGRVADSISGELHRSSCLPHMSPDDALIVEGKRRWKPSYKVQLKLRELNVFGAGTSRFPFRRNLGSSTDASESVNSSDKETYSQSTSSQSTSADDRSESEGTVSNGVSDKGNNSPWSGPKLNGSKVILRKARLKLDTHTSSSNEGPFSVSMGCGVSLLPGTVECGVCGAVRFYRFVKQARKFGIFSCESCRKFISKMIKRQGSSETTNISALDCHKGGGTYWRRIVCNTLSYPCQSLPVASHFGKGRTWVFFHMHVLAYKYTLGMCMVPPIVRSQQWKAGRGTLARCSYKARCPACWLKLCLRSFNIPEELRSNLVAMLPLEMRSGLIPEKQTALPTSCLAAGSPATPVVIDKTWPTKVTTLFQNDRFTENTMASHRNKKKTEQVVEKLQNKQERKSRRNIKVSQRETRKIFRKTGKSVSASKGTTEYDEHQKKRKRNSSLKVHKKGEIKPSSRNVGADSARRQRLDLKGPRVKHVCRSASIVLGQPAATFAIESPVREKGLSKVKQDIPKPPVKPPICSHCKKEHEITSSKCPNLEKNLATSHINNIVEVPSVPPPAVPTTVETKAEQSQVASGVEEPSFAQEEQPAVTVPQSYRKVNKLPPLARTLPMPAKRPTPSLQNMVSIDFWESYDPEEVCNSGFGLIGSEPFHIRAICFLCGSAGHEQLIHCASCCEPYHRFCLEDNVRDIWRCNWVCQRCTVCHTCGRGQGQQLSCQRCHKTYHSECLGADRSSSRLHSPDRPWVCPSCLRCKSCGVAEVTVFVGNLPLCKGCFKLRQKGNYCPLCQRCYEDHDYDTKMMECGKCNCWVHAKCEGLSDEKYQVLSLLPESVEFVCRMCCAMPPAPWWIAVEEELKAGYLGVLKSLSKNRKACALLKWSPKKHCSCRIPSVGKQLDFSTASLDLQSSKESESDADSIVPSKDVKRTDCILVEKPVEDSGVSVKPSGDVLSKDSATTTIHVEHMDVIPLLSSEKADEKILMKYEAKTDLEKCASISSLSSASESSLATPEPELCNSFITFSDNSCNISKENISSSENSELGTKVDDSSLKLWREKYKIKECSVRVQDCLPKSPTIIKSLPPVKVEVSCSEILSEESGKSPGKVALATPRSDSGISSTDEELKPCGLADEATEHASLGSTTRIEAGAEVTETGYSSSNGDENPVTSESESSSKDCMCLEECVRTKPSLTLLYIKKKVNAGEYSSLLQFHQEMENLISRAQCADLREMYHHTLQEVFPWFDPKYARVSSRPVHEDHFYVSSPCKLEHSNGEKQILDDSKLVGESDNSDDLSETTTPKFSLNKNPDYYYCGFKVEDVRTCVLCKGIGDGSPTEEGRLLYCGQNEWAHTNCALWSAEVFEEIDGSLQNVQSAMSRGRQIRCPWCGKRGASVGCCARNCAETYHFPCARKARCTFMDDKNVFCPTHAPDAVGKVLHLDSEFDIRRPIYVELDRKKKKFSEVPKVKFMIGSLIVESLGEFVSEASDHSDIIIPVNFRCTRLFWSSVEPWRVVQYHVKTSYQAEKPKPAMDLGKNLTVDHTLDQELLERKLDELSRWHQELDQIYGERTNEPLLIPHLETEENKLPDETKSSEENKSSEESKSPEETKLPDLPVLLDVRHVIHKYPKTEEDKIARQVLNYLLDTICSKDVDDNCLADPQNAADILPPELKDAIFEDLPHDLLDGISMQDIFPKLMSYEDPVTLDIKNDVGFSSESLKDTKDDLNEDVILNTDVDVLSAVGRSQDSVKGKRGEQITLELNSQTDGWLPGGDTKDQVQNIVDDFFQNVCMKAIGQKNTNKELKRSKSEISPQTVNKKISGTSRSQQRSCSLAWSCKLDGSVGSQMKRRKGSRAIQRGSSGEAASSLVTSDTDRVHMLQELRLADGGGLSSLARSSAPSIASAAPESVRELKFRLEDDIATTQADVRRKVSLPKEEGKENKCLLWHGRAQPRLLQLDGTVDSSSSGSEGGASPRQIDEDDDRSFMPQKKLQHNLVNKDENDEEPVRCTRCHRTYRTRSSFERHLPTCSSDFILSTSESDSENTRSSEEESSKKQQRPRSVELTKDQVPIVDCINTIRNDFKVQNVITDVKSKSPSPTFTSQVNSIHSTVIQPRPSAPTVNTRNCRQRVRPATRTNNQRFTIRNCNAVMNQSVPSQYHQSHSVVHPQSSQTSTTPTVIVQQVPSPSVVPAFVEAFQQQSGQSLQYIATIDTHSNGYTKHPFLTSAPNSLMSGAFQLQTSPDGFTGLQNGGIPVMPGVQLATSQPTVLGTIIQQPPPATIQCGMVTAEQMVLGSTPGLEMYTDQNGGMFLASQPMFIGLETVVSNTIMSSSQFVSGVVAASSSFSATTTQVFQASKLEPLMDVQPGFVIVNPHGPLSDSTGIGNPSDVITCAPPAPAPPPPQPPPPPPPPPPPLPQPIPMSLPQQPPVIPQSPISTVQSAPWRFTPNFSKLDTFVPPNSECGQFSSQLNSGVRPSNYHSENCNYKTSITKTSVSVSAPSVVSNTVSSEVCERSSPSLVKVIKTNDVPKSACSPVTCNVPVKPPTPQQQTLLPCLPSKVEKKEAEPMKLAILPTVVEMDKRAVSVPVVQNKNSNSSKPIKLVFQKQSQDGFYKISSQNHAVRFPGGTNSVPVTVQPLSSLKCIKPKPRLTTPSLVEKRKDDASRYSPLVLHSNGNLLNGTKQLQPQNGKVTPVSRTGNGSGKDSSPAITYEIRSQDGFSCTSSSITEVWQKVFEAVQQARAVHKMPPLPQNPFGTAQDGLQMLGLKHNALRYLVEQLPGVGRCIKYKPRYHKPQKPSPEDDLDALPRENSTGSARSEPFSTRSPYDMFSWLASRHRQPPKFIQPTDGESIMSNRRATSSNLPMAMRFRHLRETSKEAVGVYRSHIHGRGLFCLRDIEAGEMVIEYAGEVIRSTLTDKREKLYESKGIGCYMFRIDDQLVVDATMRGNAARFINHSCEPNCYSRVVDILGKKHILIFALRRIPQGEELTYDYKFPFEDVKIPCTCGSRRCRKYLN